MTFPSPSARCSSTFLLISTQGTLFFMAVQVLNKYVAHDVRHDLESAVWLLICVVLRHTIQVKHNRDGREIEFPRYQWYCDLFSATTERGSARCKKDFYTEPLPWEVKGNRPLTDLIRSLKTLVKQQNRNPEPGVDSDQPVPMTYKSVLTAINRALASQDWPTNDAALPFTLPRDGSDTGSQSRDRKRPREDEGTASQANSNDTEGAGGSDLPVHPAKKTQPGPSPLRKEIGRNPFE